KLLIMTNMDEQNLIDATIYYNNLLLKEILANHDINISLSLAEKSCTRMEFGTTNDWQKVIFSNESFVEIGSYSRKMVVWRMKDGEKGPLVFIKKRNSAEAINAQRY
ncbi:23848_t:CDS:2, partial [Racocetra persica]